MLSHILITKEIKVKIMSKIVEGNDVIFPWRAYRSLVLHILIWSTNFSSLSNCIFINVNIDKIEDGAIIQNIQPVVSQTDVDADDDKMLLEYDDMDD